MRFPERLMVVAKHIPGGCTVADVGTGHCLLPLYLGIREGATLIRDGATLPRSRPFVIAVESSPGPFRASLATLRKASRDTGVDFLNLVDLRLGDGLEAVREGEADVLVIAGIGGEGIARILEKDLQKSRAFRRLVFQPSSRPWYLRRWLLNNGFFMSEEDLVLEGGRFFEIVVAGPEPTPAGFSGDHLVRRRALPTEPSIVAPNAATSWNRSSNHFGASTSLKRSTDEAFVAEILWEVGPLLWLQRHPLLGGYLEEIARRYASIGERSGMEAFARKAACLRAIAAEL